MRGCMKFLMPTQTLNTQVSGLKVIRLVMIGVST